MNPTPIIVTVSGGVAEVALNESNVPISIVDFDNLNELIQEAPTGSRRPIIPVSESTLPHEPRLRVLATAKQTCSCRLRLKELIPAKLSQNTHRASGNSLHEPLMSACPEPMFGDRRLADGYSSSAQRARRISEDWIARHGYCLRCSSDRLLQTAANTRTRDFSCPACNHYYELKSKRGAFGNRVLDGAHSAMVETIRCNRTPTFLLLEYTPVWSITTLIAIHHSLITEEAVVARKPLSQTARRANWVGCNILLSSIAVDGRIPLVKDSVLQPPEIARAAFMRLEILAALPQRRRSWAATVLNLVRKLPFAHFTLADLYAFEEQLQSSYPENNNIRAKIRQQLQVLRDSGLVRFHGSGQYEIVSSGGA